MIERLRIECGDSRHVLPELAADSLDSCVCDPPYALASIQRRFAKIQTKDGSRPGPYQRTARGFMGQSWDTGETAFDPAFWAEVYRVLKPGAHLIAFGGPRTYHRLVCAIEDAGFEIRDQLAWVYATGFPKSHNQKGDWDGWGTGLKPGMEPIVLARKPLDGTVAANLARWGVGALNIAGCRVETVGPMLDHTRTGEPSAERRYTEAGVTPFSLKPGPRGGDPRGRWPANVLHDGSGEVVAFFPNAPGQQRPVRGDERSKLTKHVYGEFKGSRHGADPRGDVGSAARFFYSAKATTAEREGSGHPTVKPIALMRWLCRLVTPPGGVVLDPFAGSGTTGVAALREGFGCVLIERNLAYYGDLMRRMASAEARAA